MRKLSHILSCLFLVCAASCKRVPLYDADSSVYLNVQISTSTGIVAPEPLNGVIPDGLRTKLDGRVPERLQVNFYDVETHKLVTKAYVGPTGGFVDITSGLYDVVVYNIDSDATRAGGVENLVSAYAYTAEDGTRVFGKYDHDISSVPQETFTLIREPDHFYVGRREDVLIPEHSAEDETIVINITANTLVDAYILRVLNVNGIENFGAAKAYFTGQVRAREIWDGRNILEPAAIAVNCGAARGLGEIYSVFNTFGKYPGASGRLFLNIDVANSSGDKREYVFDVTDQFDNPDNTNHVIMVTERIDIPKPGSSSGGLAPDVDDWDETHKDIDL